ncbi:MAG: hypothetical protein LBG05_02620 [Treponema sp.]|nr:hypothetical protein [Treponema sp.]
MDILTKNETLDALKSTLRPFIKVQSCGFGCGLPLHASTRSPVLAPATMPELDSSIIRQITVAPDGKITKGEKGPMGEIVKAIIP